MTDTETKTNMLAACPPLTDVLSTKRPPSFNEWFLSLPEGRQAVLRDDKWMLAQAAFDAGMNLGTAYAIGG